MPPPDPASPTTDLSRSVAADMEAIFAQTPVQAAAMDETPVQVLRRSASDQGRLRPAVIGLILATGLTGVAAGILIPRPPAAPPPPIIVAAAAPAPIVPAAAAAPAAVSVADIQPAAHIAPIRTARPRAVAVIHRHPAEPDVMAADRRLRAAYARAVQAGVARPILADYRDRWADLRERDADRPERLAVAYRELSDDLGRMTAHPRAFRAEPMDEPRLRSPFRW
jgi:hypothetical protein